MWIYFVGEFPWQDIYDAVIMEVGFILSFNHGRYTPIHVL